MFFRKLFGGNKKKQHDSQEAVQSNDEPHIHYPRLTREYSEYDLPTESHFFLLWDVQNISDPELLEKVYNHLMTASEIVYYAHKYGIVCSVKTKRYGWCRLNIHWSLCYTEFGIYKSRTRFDIDDISELKKCPNLFNFINKFTEKVWKLYEHDSNL